MVTGKPIEGISGTKAFSMNVYGNIVNYVNDEKEYAYTNEKGESLEHRSYLDNGCYVVSEEDSYTLYDSDGKKHFSGSTEEFVPSGVVGEFFIAKKHVDGKYTYALMDMNGKVISGEFEDSIISRDGNLVNCYDSDSLNNILCSLDGKSVTPDGYKYGSFEEVFGFAWSVKSGDNTVIIDGTGNMLLSNITDMSNFVAKKKINNETYCYSYKDKDYTIKGHDIAPWLVKGTDDYSSYFICDTFSGEKIIDGYKQFDTAVDKGEGIYVYAKNADSSTDIYLVK